MEATQSMSSDQTRVGRRSMDRLSSLPSELLLHILSSLKTKDAFATTLVSKRMGTLQPWITTLDLDDSPISHCLDHPCRIESFPAFKMFVDKLLKSSISPHLDVFRLRFGVDVSGGFRYGMHSCNRGWRKEKDCFPDVNPTDVDAWICFPLTRSISELDLCFCVRKPGKLPSALFNCETLQVMKLNMNLEAEHDFLAMPSFHLPNLKVLHLYTIRLPQSYFVTKLVSSCPSLEDFVVKDCHWNDARNVTISSQSLRRLRLEIFRWGEQVTNSDLMLIDTPNLQEFFLWDTLMASHYSINANALVEASIVLDESVAYGNPLRIMLSILTALSDVRCLYLSSVCTEALCTTEYYEELEDEELEDKELEDELPMFHNLKNLWMFLECYKHWNMVLKFLYSSPVLEELCLQMDLEATELELRQCWETNNEAIPCCKYHLKRIVIKVHRVWSAREMELVKFLLSKALVLEELLVCQIYSPETRAKAPSQGFVEQTLNELPRASATCSIRVQ